MQKALISVCHVTKTKKDVEHVVVLMFLEKVHRYRSIDGHYR